MSMPLDQMRLVFAHRGLNRLAPENTIPAFEKAANAGISWVETDVDIADGIPVLLHDTTLDRTTDYRGSVYELTADQISHVDAGSWFSDEFKGTALPTLRDFIEFLNQSGMNANIELKPHETGARGTLDLIEAVIAELARLDDSRQVIISSFSALSLFLFHQRAPEYRIGMLWDEDGLPSDWVSVMEMVGAQYAHLADSAVTSEVVQQIADRGYGVNVWTVNDPRRAAELFDWGCTGVFSDVADQLVATHSQPTETASNLSR